jgi:hypothetical protein
MVGILRRFDRWFGTRVAHPPIIWICQRLGINQHAFHRLAWWIAALLAVASDHDGERGTPFVWLGIAAVRTLGAGLLMSQPTRDLPIVRFLTWCTLIVWTLPLILVPRDIATTGIFLYALLALFAEYATTIRTIPPRELPAADFGVQNADA